MVYVGLNRQGCVLVVIEGIVRLNVSRIGLVRCRIFRVGQPFSTIVCKYYKRSR